MRFFKRFYTEDLISGNLSQCVKRIIYIFGKIFYYFSPLLQKKREGILPPFSLPIQNKYLNILLTKCCQKVITFKFLLAFTTTLLSARSFFFPWQASQSQLSCDYSSSLLKKLGIKTLSSWLLLWFPKLRSLFSLSTQTVMTNIKFTLD